MDKGTQPGRTLNQSIDIPLEVPCPECGTAVLSDQVDLHLRQSHGLFQFRGVRRRREETIVALLQAICNSKPDYQAWEALEKFAREEKAPENFLAAQVSQALAARGSTPRNETLQAVADVLAGSATGLPIMLLLASSSERVSRHLALVLAKRLLQKVRPAEAGYASLTAALKPLLAHKRAPAYAQVAAAAALLRTNDKDGKLASEIVDALTARAGKARAVDRLRQLEREVGSHPLISDRCAQIENRIRMRCPRCRIQFRRPQMAIHLWRDHSLLLDGRRVRTPWRMIEAWIDDYHHHKSPEILTRCRTLGQHLDPDHGLHRVHRLLLAKGIADAEASRQLLAEAKQRQASLCPHCYASVPVVDEVALRPLNQSRGRLSLGGYTVEVSERGLVPHLLIETPNAVVYRGREPHVRLTRQSAVLFLAGPLVVAALAFALLLDYVNVSPLAPVILVLLMALAIYVVVRLHWGSQAKPVDRAVDYAWTWLAPGLPAEELTEGRSTFLAGLALVSMNHGQAEVRAASLSRALLDVEQAIAARSAPLGHLAVLRRLEAEDAAKLGHDPVTLVADQVARCFRGELPLVFAQKVLEEWESRWWTNGNLGRLRVLLCDRAFEAGLEVRDLLEMAPAAQALAEVLQTDQPQGLAQLRLLWSLRPRRPWDNVGDPLTVFELAAEPERGEPALAKCADLLLIDRDTPSLLVCGRGVIYRDILFSEAPRRVEIKVRRDFDGVEYELLLGDHRLPFVHDPGPVTVRLQRWFRYQFEEFLPQVADVDAWQTPPGSKPLSSPDAVACPECGRLLITRRGEVGLTAEGDCPGQQTGQSEFETGR
jgi:hypothetical protein